MKSIVALGVGLLAAGCSVVGVRSGTEEPHFTIVERFGTVEIRRYDARVAIETSVAGDEETARSEGFRRLAGYIFGDNRARAKIAMTAPVAQSSEKIAMTAPVAQERDASGNWRIRFFAPSTYRLESMPIPNNPLVSIAPVASETVAVMRFTGSRSADSIHERETELLASLASGPWRAVGAPVAWFYDPPWTIPSFRRDEVAVQVSQAPS